MASSAFPLVFSRVEMSYCLPVAGANSRQNLTTCPANHFLDTNYFIDGGVFDNVPVGVAVELVNARRTAADDESSHSYIFLDAEGGVEDYTGGTEPDADYSFGGQVDLSLIHI